MHTVRLSFVLIAAFVPDIDTVDPVTAPDAMFFPAPPGLPSSPNCSSPVSHGGPQSRRV